MPNKVPADARPEKRLFISLITRDVSLIEAFQDLLDNSINAALEPLASKLKSADDYQRLLTDNKQKPKVDINLRVGTAKIFIEDNAGGIPLDTAQKHVFRFGREDGPTHELDRLSVYGIGLKRALFKCGNKFEIVSDHRNGGFELKETVAHWATQRDDPWQFMITPRPAKTTGFGTKISITELHDDVVSRIGDGLFMGELRERVASTYSFYIGRVVNINIEGKPVERETFEIGNNYASEKFEHNGVSCTVTAGIGRGITYNPGRNAGWFVFCNGRTVLSADKSQLTGWGAGGGLPIFQPKHRPFVGTVFFVSADPEALPWTTTKGSINEESLVWQKARREMITVGRVVTNFLDKRYADDGSTIPPSDLHTISGAATSVLAAAVSKKRSFSPPKPKQPRRVKIQYDVSASDLQKVQTYLQRPGMSGADVGRYTFDYFLRNEVGDEK